MNYAGVDKIISAVLSSQSNTNHAPAHVGCQALDDLHTIGQQVTAPTLIDYLTDNTPIAPYEARRSCTTTWSW